MLVGWYLIAAALLALSGGAKVRHPEPTRRALRAAGLPGGGVAVVALGGLEAVVGLWALASGGRAVALGVAALYAAFAGFVLMALVRRLPVRSCGCFGRPDTPPTPLHLAVNVASAAAALTLALGAPPAIPDVIARQPAAGIPYLAFLGMGVWLLVLALTDLPTLPLRGAR